MKVTSVVLGFAPFLLVGFSSSMVIGTPLSLLPEVAQDNATDYVLVEHLSRRGDKKQTHEEFYKNLKKEQHRDKKAFKKAEKKRKKKHLPEPIAEPVDPRLPNITLLIQRYMTYDCQGPVLDPVVIEATAEPVCFEFPTPNKFGSVNVQDGLSEMTWGAAAGPERDAKCKMVTYRNRVCHSKRRMTAYPFSVDEDYPDNEGGIGTCFRSWKWSTVGSTGKKANTWTGFIKAFTIECPGLIDPVTFTGRKYKERMQRDGDWVEPEDPEAPKVPKEKVQLDPFQKWIDEGARDSVDGDTVEFQEGDEAGHEADDDDDDDVDIDEE